MRFGTTGFNYPYEYDQFAQLSAHGIGGVVANAAFSVTVSIGMSASGGVIAKAAYTITEGVGAMGSSGTLKVKAGRDESAIIKIDGIGAIVINNESASVTTIHFLGSIPPGSQIIIDTDRYTVEKDGLNALMNFDGEFCPLSVGVNEITYSDTAPSRTVEMSVIYTERFI